MFLKVIPGLFVFCCLLGGCRPANVSEQDARDRNEPYMRRAKQREQSGDLDGAISLYQQAIDENPRVAEAHLSLALLMHDYKQDYIEAVYNYRAYLRKRPDTEKAALLRDRIRKAEQLLAARLARTLLKDGSAGMDVQSLEEVQTLKQRLAAGEKEKAALREENRDLKNRLAASEREIERLRRRVEMLVEPPSLSRPGESLSVRQLITGGSGTDVRTYEVKVGDTLSRIAQLCYGDAKEWRRIRDANLDKVDGQDRVQPGQILVIPPQ